MKNCKTFIREGTRRTSFCPRRNAEANGQGTHKGCPYGRGRRGAGVRGAPAVDGRRGAYEGTHKGCPYEAWAGWKARRVRGGRKGCACGGWKARRVRGHPQGVPLRAWAAGGGHKGCACGGWKARRVRGHPQGVPLRGVGGGGRAVDGRRGVHPCGGRGEVRLRRVRGHPQGVPLRAWAAGGGRKGCACGGCEGVRLRWM